MDEICTLQLHIVFFFDRLTGSSIQWVLQSLLSYFFSCLIFLPPVDFPSQMVFANLSSAIHLISTYHSLLLISPSHQYPLFCRVSALLGYEYSLTYALLLIPQSVHFYCFHHHPCLDSVRSNFCCISHSRRHNSFISLMFGSFFKQLLSLKILYFLT